MFANIYGLNCMYNGLESIIRNDLWSMDTYMDMRHDTDTLTVQILKLTWHDNTYIYIYK